MKDSSEVVQEFNELVNMTAAELEKWLKSDDSNSAGWPKEDENGETVGHDSGRKIVEILKSNPDKDPEKYTEDQVQHMRKVVSYCKRHLAQESKGNNEKSEEEVKKTKSYASLKNWGHDFLKAKGEGGAEEEEAADEQAGDEQAGDKRKPTTAQQGSNKKRETQKGATTSEKKDDNDEADGETADEDEDEDEDKENNNSKANRSAKQAKSNSEAKGNDEDDAKGDDAESSSAKPKKGPKKGDTVSWNWGNGQPQGKVLDVKAEKTSIETKKGNQVSRNGDAEDPAVVLDTGKSKAIKSNHELN